MKIMTEEILRRTKAFGIMIIHLVDLLANKPSGWAISKQIVRSSTSVGANYRASRKSKADFINKLKIVEEECDETIFWLEVIEETKLLSNEKDRYYKKRSSRIISNFCCLTKNIKNTNLNFILTSYIVHCTSICKQFFNQ
ncbi:MAG: four helix bundle protein [Saprospiraceae bacterium]